ncbi:hypothetical protein [Bacillus sp. 1P06AnD]|uniref:hypothetical protein n=1 Tax=Bacillus sp. 1P06AnD TaxID=3132208 RepID=UPI0039A0196B
MATCTHCTHKWKPKEIWALGFSKKGKCCPYCGTRQYISGGTQGLLTLGFISLLFILLFPFIIQLSEKEEPLW